MALIHEVVMLNSVYAMTVEGSHILPAVLCGNEGERSDERC